MPEATSDILRVLSQDAGTLVSPLVIRRKLARPDHITAYLLKVRADVDDKEKGTFVIERNVCAPCRGLTLRGTQCVPHCVDSRCATHSAAPIAMI